MARVTDIITSIDSNTSEAVTIDTAWTGTDGDLILSASVPAAVVVGDTITDASANTYLITGISGSTLTSQDFDTTTDPATGSATIQDAYAGATAIGLWEADLDDTALYASGDDAIGECYNNVAFDEVVTVNGGGTVGLGSIKLTVPSTERHDGTGGTGARIVRTGTGNTLVLGVAVTVEWLEIDGANQGSQVRSIDINVGSTIKNMIIHDVTNSSGACSGIDIANVNVDVLNTIIYDVLGTAAGTAGTYGIFNVGGTSRTYNFLNNTIYNVLNNNGTGEAFGMNDLDDVATYHVRNNIIMGTGGTSSGTIQDFDFQGSSNIDTDTNMSADATADDGGGSGHLVSKTTANQFVSTVSDNEDLHLKSGADAIDAGTDLVTTPTGVNFDIDNRDRDSEGDTWDIGADEFVSSGLTINVNDCQSIKESLI